MLRRILAYYCKKRKPILYAKKIGVTIGENCRLITSPNWGSEPWLISIGNHTEVSFDVAFVTHDGSTWVFRDKEEYRNTVKFGRIKVGNDCFIGARSVILPGVKIHDYSIVAAGSVVNKDVPAGEVWGGVPAHFIMTTEEYARKCKKNTPKYDLDNYQKNFIDEVNNICDSVERERDKITLL